MNSQTGTSKSVRYGDKNYENELIKWFEEDDQDGIDNESDAPEEKSQHDSDSEQEVDDTDDRNDLHIPLEESDDEGEVRSRYY